MEGTPPGVSVGGISSTRNAPVVFNPAGGYSQVMRKRRFFSTIMAIFFPLILAAQEQKPLILMVPFTIKGISSEEAEMIESLVRSYTSGVGQVIFYLDETVPDYTLTGSILQERDNRVLMLEITKNSNGETVYYTSAHKTFTELALKTRSVVETAFGAGSPLPAGDEDSEPIRERSITGTWRGDGGIEMIRFQGNGRALAFFSSGAQMELSYTIENNVLKIRQVSANNERFYHPLPLEVARELAARSEPMEWELLLYEGGNILRGIRIFTSVRYEGSEIRELFPGTAEGAEWVRAAH